MQTNRNKLPPPIVYHKYDRRRVAVADPPSFGGACLFRVFRAFPAITRNRIPNRCAATAIAARNVNAAIKNSKRRDEERMTFGGRNPKYLAGPVPRFVDLAS